MEFLNCYLLKAEVVDTEKGESVGDTSQYLLQVNKFDNEERMEKSTFLYLNDVIDNELEKHIIEALQDNGMINVKKGFTVNVNNDEMILRYL